MNCAEIWEKTPVIQIVSNKENFQEEGKQNEKKKYFGHDNAQEDKIEGRANHFI